MLLILQWHMRFSTPTSAFTGDQTVVIGQLRSKSVTAAGSSFTNYIQPHIAVFVTVETTDKVTSSSKFKIMRIVLVHDITL